MATRAEKIRLGIFIAITVVLLVGTLIALLGSNLWETRPEYLIRFRQSVSGLSQGSPVKLRGVRVGEVVDIHIDPKNVEVVEVHIEVRPDTPVKKDHIAIINLQGITGLKFIQLEGGTRTADPLPSGSEIEAGQNELAKLTGNMTDITAKLDQLLSHFLVITRPENQRRIDQTLSNVNESTATLKEVMMNLNESIITAQEILKENRGPINEAIQSVGKTSDHLDHTLGEVDTSLAQIRTILDQAKVPETTKELRDTSAALRTKVTQVDVQQVVSSAVQAMAALEHLLEATTRTVGENQESIRLAIESLRRASDNLQEITRTFQEKPLIQVFGDKPKERPMP